VHGASLLRLEPEPLLLTNGTGPDDLGSIVAGNLVFGPSVATTAASDACYLRALSSWCDAHVVPVPLSALPSSLRRLVEQDLRSKREEAAGHFGWAGDGSDDDGGYGWGGGGDDDGGGDGWAGRGGGGGGVSWGERCSDG
jgi:hypothetical protein